MKWIIPLFLIFIFVNSSAEIIHLNNNEDSELFEVQDNGTNSLIIDFTLDQFNLETVEVNGTSYQHISYAGEGEFALPGKPDLPRFTRLIAVPENATLEYQILDQEIQAISDITVYPRQYLQSDERSTNEFLIDTEFYTSGNVFPANQITVGDPAYLRDFRVISLTLDPFSYDTARQELQIFHTISLELTFSGSSRPEVIRNDHKISRAFEPLYRSSILNYDLEISRDTEYQLPSYLFIYPDNDQVENYLTTLLEWKHQKGFVVNAASTSETGTSSTSIKNYLDDAFDDWEDPPEFVCLVGDANGSYYIPTASQGGGVGDQFYACLEGNDILADVFMGRLAFNSTSELATIIAKILNYEKTPYLGSTEWYEDVLLVGDPGSSGVSTISTNLYIKDIIENYSDQYDFTEVYSSPFVSGMANAVNNGVSYFNYRGYYGVSGWDNGDINSLNNGYMLPVVVCITCGTGDFDSSWDDALSEYFLKAGTTTTPRGAIASIGTATLSTHTCFNNCVSAGTADGIFVDEIFNMGGALTRGKLDLYLNYPGNPGGWVTNFSYWNNLMGDPGMELWTGVPQEMTVDHEATIALGTNYYTVNVSDNAGSSLNDARVTLLKGDDEIFTTGLTNSIGEIYLPITDGVSGEVALTVTKHDFIPFTSTFNIVQQEQFVSIENMFIDDDDLESSNGNGDGLVNPGETIELQLSLKNQGTSTVNGISAQLYCENGNLELINDQTSFGDLTAGAEVTGEDDYLISFLSSIPGDAVIPFTLLISDNSGNFWDDRFNLIINGPVLQFSSAVADDSGNGIFDPGENAPLNIELYNAGMADIESVTALLSTEDDRITIIDNEAYFTAINAGESAFNTNDNLEIEIYTQTIPGSQLWLELQLTNSSGFQQNIPFFLEIGTVNSTDPLGPDVYGYYIYDNSDVDYSLAPVYNWIEIDPDNGGSGTILGLNDYGNEGDSEVIDLPDGFRFIYYGQEYSQITVCSNGWIAPGETDNFEFMNWHIPGLLGPSPLIAPFWDDLMTSNGNICYYYEEAANRYIIEWSELRSEYNNDTETFQVIIYDSLTYPSLTGDSDILFQYHTINNVDQGNYNYGVQHGQYGSVGIEDPTSTIGLEYTYNNQYPAAAETLQDELALLITTNQAMIVDPPIAVIEEEEISVSVLPGESGSAAFEIANEGEANLVYNIHKVYIDNAVSSYRDEGGPDDYGYIWIDSNQENGPQFEWIDISAIGTLVEFSHNDEGSDLIAMDFSFNYYGTDYDEFRINPNGWIGFGEDSSEWLNTEIPSTDAPRPALMPYWDDLYPDDGEDGGGQVYYYSTPESLIVMFDQVIHYPGAHNGTYDFELIIYPDGEILYQYNSVSGDIDTCTIGLQNGAGDDGLMVVYDLEYVENNLAIRFKRVIDWLSVEPASGSIISGQNQFIDLAMDTSELIWGHFICDLVITTNDPNLAELILPVNLYLATQEQNIYVEETSLDFGEVIMDSSLTIPLTIHNFGLDSLHLIDVYSDNENFQVDFNQQALGYNETSAIPVTFAPTTTGHYDGQLYITSDDPDDPEVYVTISGTGTDGTAAEDDLPAKTALLGNYPNPFNPETTISFILTTEPTENTELYIYNIKGQKIKTLVDPSTPALTQLRLGRSLWMTTKGEKHSIIWNGKDDNGKPVPSGVYFYKLKTNNFEAARKMVLLK